MVGETFDGNRDLIKSYVNPETMLDGQFDFPLRGQLLSTILRRDGAMSDLTNFLASNDGYYGAGAIMSTFLGNHDVPRAVELALDSPLFGAWDNGANLAWSGQPPQPTDVNPYQRLAVGYAILFTMPGVPMLYYGDEYGQAGAGDPDNRRFMSWSGQNANQVALHDRIKGLIKMRAAHPATRHGTRQLLGVAQDVAVFTMSAPGDTVYVALNRGDSPQPALNLPDGDYLDLVTGAEVLTPVSLPPRTALVLGVK
jgi:glycosidase